METAWLKGDHAHTMETAWLKGDHAQVSIDRKDGALAHTRDNCQLLCLACNKRKH